MHSIKETVMTPTNRTTTVIITILAILLALWLLTAITGCTCYISAGKQIDADEIIIRRYNSKPDISPELISALKLLIAAEAASGDIQHDQPAADDHL